MWERCLFVFVPEVDDESFVVDEMLALLEWWRGGGNPEVLYNYNIIYDHYILYYC